MNTQRTIAKFVAAAPDPWVAPALPRIRDAFADTMSCAVAGRNESVCQQALAYAPPQSSGKAEMWIALGRASREDAALVNAVAAHALDYDDVAPAFRGHPSAVLFPSILATASDETKGVDVFGAYAIGFEVATRLGEAMIAKHYPAGWHSSATIGVIAAAAACSRLLRLPEDRVSHALGLAVSQAAGMQANFGTGAKPFQVGFAASAAVRSVRLAALGVTSSGEALESPKGFSGLYGSGAELSSAFRDLGAETPEILRSGIEMKYLPACYATHRAVTAVGELKREFRLSAREIDSITVLGSAGSHDPLLTRLPRTPDEAKFSMEYACAVALTDGAVGLGSFSEQAFARPELRDLMSRVRVSEANESSSERWSDVVIVTRSGNRLHKRVAALAAGTGKDLRAKIEDCLAFADLGDIAGPFQEDLQKFEHMTVGAFFSGTAMTRVRGAGLLRAIA